MSRLASLALAAAAGLCAAVAGAPGAPGAPVRFRRHVLDSGRVWNSVVAADLNRDGRTDVAAAGPEEAAWYERGPDPDHWSRRLICRQTKETGSLDTIWLLPYDLDGDGDLDLLSSTPANGSLAWYENPGGMDAWKRRLIDNLPRIHSEAVGDVDGDGRPDLVANTDGMLVWYPIPKNARELLPDASTGAVGEGPRWTRRVLTHNGVAGTPHYLKFAAVANGGAPVLLAAAPDAGYLAWWNRSRTGPEPWMRHAVREAFPGGSHLIPADMDGDGKLDLFYNRGHSAGSGWLAGPEFARETVIDPGALREPHALALGDLNGDGAPDVAAAGRNAGGLMVRLNDGKGRFTAQTVDPGQKGMDVKIADVDGDGRADILVAGAAGKDLVWYESIRPQAP